jgi:sulfide:quinone oxidoreductase
VTAIDPQQRRVTTDKGSYDADVLVVALGADYDYGATPGFARPSGARGAATRFPDVYAVGDIANGTRTVAKAGVFAETAARVVADDIAVRLAGGEPPRTYEGNGNCYIESGAGMVGKVEANFLGAPQPTARVVGPSRELAVEKQAFGATRRARWFGR